MSNNRIIQHMIKVLDQYEAKMLRASEVEESLDQYAQAIEGLSSNSLYLVRTKVAQLVKADLADGEEGFVQEISAASALEQLRALVRSLPNG